MSKKTLLNENTVREFMKYANLGGLSDNFINENYMEEDAVEEVAHAGKKEEGMYEEAVEEGMGTYAEEEHGIAPTTDDMPVDDAPEAPIDDMPIDDAPSEELPPEAVSALEQAVEKAAEAMLDALAPFGVEGEASVEGDEAPLDVAPEAPVDDAPLGDEDEEDMGVDMLDEEEIVQETMKRVMNRLKLMKEGKQAEDKKSDMINSVADAIVARLRTKK